MQMAQETYSQLLQKVIAGEDLSQQEAYEAFGQIMSGRWSEAQIGGLLAALAAAREKRTGGSRSGHRLRGQARG